jgi:EamA-like transporter family
VTSPGESERRVPLGVGFAIASALLFGLSTPCAKMLLGDTPLLLLAGLLYAGSGLGLFLVRLLSPVATVEAPITRADVPWLAGAVVAGGILGPVLLMSGLLSTPASAASLLLNLEGVFTALLAWFVFRENFDCASVDSGREASGRSASGPSTVNHGRRPLHGRSSSGEAETIPPGASRGEWARLTGSTLRVCNTCVL